MFCEHAKPRGGVATEVSVGEPRVVTTREFAGVAELVYALVLGTSAARLEGSSPSSSTKIKEKGYLTFVFQYAILMVYDEYKKQLNTKKPNNYCFYCDGHTRCTNSRSKDL